MEHKSHWKTLSSKIAYECPWYKIREDQVIRPDGKPGTYSVLVKHDGAFIVAVNNEQKIFLIGQFRYPTQRYSWEIVAGSTDGEDPLVAAKRELHEEAGLIANTWTALPKFQSYNGIGAELGHIYVATDLEEAGDNEQAEEGIDETKWVSFPEAFAMIANGKITDSQSVTSITQAALHLGLIAT